MKHSLLLAMCLLAVPGLACGQEGFDSGAFNAVFTGSSGRVFPIGNLDGNIYGPLLQDRAHLLTGALYLDSPDQPSPLFTIVDEGMRMPDKSQLRLPSPQ